VRIKEKGMQDANDDEIYHFKEFAFDTVNVPFPTVLLVGKRNSGKSVTAQSIAAAHTHIERWCVWVGTKATADYWSERLGSHASIYGTNEQGKHALIRAIQFQNEKVQLYKSLKKPLPRKYYIGFIFDDVTSDRAFSKGGLLETLFSNGRHYHAVVIVSCQYLKQLPPPLRNNTDYLFMLHNSKRTMHVLYEDYVENPDEFDMFAHLLRTVTSEKNLKTGLKKFNSLVYDNTSGSDLLNEIFKVFTPPQGPVQPILLGSAEWRTFNEANFIDRNTDEQLRKFRKREHVQQIRQRQQENLRRREEMQQMYGVVLPAEVDVFSDSDESETAKDAPRVIMLQRRRGAPVQVVLPSADSKELVEVKLQPQLPAPLPLLDLRGPVPDARYSASGPRSYFQPPLRDTRYSASAARDQNRPLYHEQPWNQAHEQPWNQAPERPWSQAQPPPDRPWNHERPWGQGFEPPVNGERPWKAKSPSDQKNHWPDGF